MSRREEVLGRWLHSREENEGGVRVYRPEDYQFPPSRGRDGFEIRPEGEFIQLSIAPTDGLLETAGEWSIDGDRISVSLEDGTEYTLHVVGDGDDLWIERRPK